jgi:hypothetical protein
MDETMFQNSDAGIAKVIKRSTVVWRKYKGTTEVQDPGKCTAPLVALILLSSIVTL